LKSISKDLNNLEITIDPEEKIHLESSIFLMQKFIPVDQFMDRITVSLPLF